jgi:hypothetical protein
MNSSYRLTSVIVLLFAAVLGIAYLHGPSSRSFAVRPLGTIVVDAPSQAVELWQKNRLKGRVLFLFDSYPHMNGYAYYNNRKPTITTYNFVEYSIFQNVVRSIYFIVPDQEWGNLKEQPELKTIRSVYGLRQGEYMLNLNGVPVIATTLSSLPHLSEFPLVYINEAYFKREVVLQSLREKNIVSDCIIIYRRGQQ